MAEIRNYNREKQKRTQTQKRVQSPRREKSTDDYRSKIRKHRLNGALKIAAAVLAVGILITLFVVQYNNHIYTSYDIVSSRERLVSQNSMDVRLGNTVLTYSKDGAHCTDSKGNVLWNQTYEIQDILIDICQDVAVIASYNGRDVYVVSAKEILGSFTTNLPIRSVSASAEGRVVVVMAENSVTYYNTYSAQGELLFEGQATMSGSGYPMSVSLSPDGEMMQISYIYLDAGVQKTNVVFYNLGPVGANSTDYMVSAYEYKDVLIPYVRFMDNGTAFAVGDNVLMIYKGSQKPVLEAEFRYDEKVKAVFYNEDYVGLIFYSETGTSLYEMNVYSAGGTLVGTYHFDIEYTDVIFVKDSFIVHNDAECLIMTLDNEEKYRGSFNKSVRRMIPLKTAYKYMLVTPDSFDTIKLK